MIKRIFTGILIIAMLMLTLSSCSNYNFDDLDDTEEKKTSKKTQNSKNTLTCGVTIIPGLNEKDANGNWTGFESEFAIEVGKIIGMNVEFKEIAWNKKYDELNSGNIDCIWNAFTSNTSDTIDGIEMERSKIVDLSYSYMRLQQCIITRKSNLSSYTDTSDFLGKIAAVKAGSTGDSYAQELVGKTGQVCLCPAQINAFTEVLSGAADFAVVDISFAESLCGKGDFANLAIVETVELPAEYYAIGFRKGSDLPEKVNKAIKQLDENGKLLEIATKYGLENLLYVKYD